MHDPEDPENRRCDQGPIAAIRYFFEFGFYCNVLVPLLKTVGALFYRQDEGNNSAPVRFDSKRTHADAAVAHLFVDVRDRLVRFGDSGRVEQRHIVVG